MGMFFFHIVGMQRGKLQTHKQIFVVLVTVQGARPTLYFEDMIARVLTLKDLFI